MGTMVTRAGAVMILDQACVNTPVPDVGIPTWVHSDFPKNRDARTLKSLAAFLRVEIGLCRKNPAAKSCGREPGPPKSK